MTYLRFVGLERNEYHSLAKEYLTGGFGGVLSFGVKGGARASDILVDRLRIISNMTKLVT